MQSKFLKWFVVLLALGWTMGSAALWAGEQDGEPGVDEILAQVEKRYAQPFFSAFFLQETVLQAMDISDSAFGRIQVQRPGKMRWEYEKPEKQTIVTDGQTLWMYRPADHQVMIGQAPAFLRGGQGAGFLSDMGHLQKKFLILKALEKNSDHYILKLLPEEEMADVADIRIWVAKATGLIAKIVTTNAYGDETRIELSQFEFSGRLDDDLFNFEIPAGADVVRLDDPAF